MEMLRGTDELASSISQPARRPRIGEKRRGGVGALRLIAPKPGISELLDNSIGHIAIYAAGDRFVLDGLYRALDLVEGDLQGETELLALSQLRNDLRRRQRAKANP